MPGCAHARTHANALHGRPPVNCELPFYTQPTYVRVALRIAVARRFVFGERAGWPGRPARVLLLCVCVCACVCLPVSARSHHTPPRTPRHATPRKQRIITCTRTHGTRLSLLVRRRRRRHPAFLVYFFAALRVYSSQTLIIMHQGCNYPAPVS